MGPCSSCGSEASPVRRSRAWWIVVGALWAAFLFLGVCSALLLPLNMVLVPCWLAVASSVGPWARELLDPRCGGCGAIGSPARAPYLAGGASRPADERPVEGALVGEAEDQRDLGDRVRTVREVGRRKIAS